MRPELRQAIDLAFLQARHAMAVADHATAYAQLERAHILSQRFPLLHARAHCWMLITGWRSRDTREVLGQATRILAALLFSRLWVPLGNSGRARVSALKPMPVAEDLRRLLQLP